MKKVKIRIKGIAIAAYLYMILPICIFYLGWLKIYLSIPLVIAIVTGFIMIIRKDYGDESLSIDVLSLVLLLFMTAVWVYTSGVGGFWLQREDWHWRNAILRDLIDYSWPVVYPDTGSALAYYFNFFLPAALAGKVLGFGAANLTLMLYTWLGIVIVALLLLDYVGVKNAKKVFAVVLVLIIWGGLEDQRTALFKLLDLEKVANYEYSSNSTLLQWVTNQTIVPWIAMLLFLGKRRVGTYAYLGLCVFASAPLPFIGFVIFLLADGVNRLDIDYKMDCKKWLKNMFSAPNIIACVCIFTVYLLFYLCNSISSGDAGTGGFGLYVSQYEFSIKNLIMLTSFLFFNFAIYAIIVYRNNKDDMLALLMVISLCFMPLFKIGTGIDFCMRASIPALFYLMILVIKYLVHPDTDYRSLKTIALMTCLAIALNNAYLDFIPRFEKVVAAESMNDLMADGIYTFANKTNDGNYCGGPLLNFLCEDKEKTLFFSKLTKKKTVNQEKSDMATSMAYMKDAGFTLPTGLYRISPAQCPEKYVAVKKEKIVLQEKEEDLFVSNSTVNGKNEMYSLTEKRVWRYNETNDSINLAFYKFWQEWGDPEVPEEYLFEIVETANGYMILWNDEMALTWDGEEVSWTTADGNERQIWYIERQDL